MLDYTTFAKQIISFQKFAVNSTLDSLFSMQDQTNKVTGSMFDKSLNLPSEGKKMISEWGKLFKKRQVDYRKIIDSNINLINSCFTETGKTAKTAAK